MVSDNVPQPGKQVFARVDQTLSDDLAVCLGAGMTVTDAIKYGVCLLAQQIRKQQRPGRAFTRPSDSEEESV